MAITSTSASDTDPLDPRGRYAERLWMLVGGATALSALVATATWAAVTVAGFAPPCQAAARCRPASRAT